MTSGFIPVWAVTALGRASGRSGVPGPHAQPVPGRFAFTFAMPALLFLTLSTAPVGGIAEPGVAVFAISLPMLFATPLIMVLIDLDVHRGVRGQWRRFAQLPPRNPVIGASVAGVAVAALGSVITWLPR